MRGQTDPGSPYGHRRRVARLFDAGGAEAWEDSQLLEMLLFHAQPRKDTKRAARALLARFGNLASVLDASPSDCADVPGIGPSTVRFLRLARELVKRYFRIAAEETDLLSAPEAAARYAAAQIGGEPNEVVLALFLDTRNRLKRTFRVTEGTVDRAPLFPRRIVEEALRAKAKNVILAHNHPSGNHDPSPDDRALTDAVRAALATVGLTLHDHLVVTRTSAYSFRRAGPIAPDAFASAAGDARRR